MIFCTQKEIERRTFTILQPYAPMMAQMAERVRAIRNQEAPEALWFLEHPAVYTAGPRTSALPTDVPVVCTARGGHITYHGPGQRVIYTLVHLTQRGLLVSDFVRLLEKWIMDALADIGIAGTLCPPHTGVWTEQGKIAAIGIHVAGGVTSHGVALNVDTDLSAFQKIVPCGIEGAAVTSVKALGHAVSMKDIDKILWATCPF